MSIDGDRAYPQGNPTPPESSSGPGTTVVGMGPIGTGILVLSVLSHLISLLLTLTSTPHHLFNITAPTVPALATQQQLTPVPSDHPDV
eukprot:2413610-Amphidinium_carterae.1